MSVSKVTRIEPGSPRVSHGAAAVSPPPLELLFGARYAPDTEWVVDADATIDGAARVVAGQTLQVQVDPALTTCAVAN
jgi:hypothetical protein